MFRRISVRSLPIILITLASCASLIPVSNRARLDGAKAELTVVRQALVIYRSTHVSSAYPLSSEITNHMELVRILAPYALLFNPPEASWTFVSYTSAHPDTFVLRAKVRDRQQTNIVVTSPAGRRESGGPQDQDVVKEVMREMEAIRKAFLAYQADDDQNAFPGASEITSQHDIVDLLSPYIQMAPASEANWRWLSYARFPPDWFVLVVDVNNEEKTVIWVTSEAVSTTRPAPPPPENRG